MIGRITSVRMFDRCLLIGALILTCGAVACGTVPKSTGIEYSGGCPVGPRAVRVTNSGAQPADLFLWSGGAAGSVISTFVGSVAPRSNEIFVIERGLLQTREAIDESGKKNQALNRPSTLRYEFFCTAADTAR